MGGIRVVWTGDEREAPPIGTAVAASCAIPGYIAPVEHQAREYVDGGGTHRPTPMS